nr:hypothetical protein CFP56_10236 [Quercus suber]
MTSRGTRKSQNPLVLERSLGFWFKQGISRPTKTDKPFIGPALDDLNLEIKRLNRIWGVKSTETIRHAPELTSEIARIFDQLAPSLWPDQPARRQALWLVDAQGTTHNGLYPKDLFASDPEDRRTLLEIFTLLIRAKLIKKKLNNDRDARDRPLQAELSDDDGGNGHDDDNGDQEISSRRHRRRERTRQHKSSGSVSRGSSSVLTDFTEDDSRFDSDMAAPPADMHRVSPVSVGPPPPYAAVRQESDNNNHNNARHSQSRASGAHTPQGESYKTNMTPESSVPRARRRESADESTPNKKHKTSGFDVRNLL